MAPPATERWCWALIRILKGLVFDHAAQFFIADDSRLIQYVDGWLEKGLVREWKGVVGELEVGGNFSQFPPSWPPRYIAVHGMRSLADSLLLESRLSLLTMVNVRTVCCLHQACPSLLNR
ncbi:uncharacterized protein LOC106386129 isoform X2 [Brassica napus]|uniref:uncharacterized protein LOC106310782 isoform X2 n=1 Tax=Brassica oleracea var. oleracea TaxID=109376 RepID=UPI0006A700C7|nr:PREDICTED: uncharacterized protein LOC106310782 isoform X2 [Brassica oleracea var. oleracea]XP_013681474.2 uncharacterized protein LOC106386129 isoform X2 [Brassica napus]